MENIKSYFEERKEFHIKDAKEEFRNMRKTINSETSLDFIFVYFANTFLIALAMLSTW